jgi:hypothetical protein
MVETRRTSRTKKASPRSGRHVEDPLDRRLSEPIVRDR